MNSCLLKNLCLVIKIPIKLYEEARAAAIITLLIRPFEGKQNLVTYIRDQLMMVQSKKSKEFLRIITRDQMHSILDEQRLQLFLEWLTVVKK